MNPLGLLRGLLVIVGKLIASVLMIVFGPVILWGFMIVCELGEKKGLLSGLGYFISTPFGAVTFVAEMWGATVDEESVSVGPILITAAVYWWLFIWVILLIT